MLFLSPIWGLLSVDCHARIDQIWFQKVWQKWLGPASFAILPNSVHLCIIVVISAHHGRTSPKFMDLQRRDEQFERPTPLALGGWYVGQVTVLVDTVFLTSKYPNLASCLITCQGCAGLVSSSHLSINCPCTQNPAETGLIFTRKNWPLVKLSMLWVTSVIRHLVSSKGDI